MATATTPDRKARHRLWATGAWRYLGFAALFAMLAAAPAHGQQKRVDDILAAIVGVHADVPVSARTADTLGTARTGSGVVIDDRGLVLTIGYLIMEAGITDVVDAGDLHPARVAQRERAAGVGRDEAHVVFVEPPLIGPEILQPHEALGHVRPNLHERARGNDAGDEGVEAFTQFAGHQVEQQPLLGLAFSGFGSAFGVGAGPAELLEVVQLRRAVAG